MFCALAIVVFSAFQDGVDRADFEQIKLGMSRREVMQIMPHSPIPYVSYADRFPRVGTVSSNLIRRNGELWQSRSFNLWVSFDDNDRVDGKMLEER
jgi:hypothetical protein